MGRKWIIGVAAVLATAAVSGIGGAASAKPLEHGDFHDEFSELVPDFCEIPGLTVQINGVVDGASLVNARGRDDLAYFKEHVRFSVMYTNVDNGKFVTSAERSVSKDLRVIDNGDGTLTIIVLATGNAAVFGAEVDAALAHHVRVQREVAVGRDVPVVRRRDVDAVDAVDADDRRQQAGLAVVAERKAHRRKGRRGRI